jgi:hypothetical protein
LTVRVTVSAVGAFVAVVFFGLATVAHPERR